MWHRMASLGFGSRQPVAAERRAVALRGFRHIHASVSAFEDGTVRPVERHRQEQSQRVKGLARDCTASERSNPAPSERKRTDGWASGGCADGGLPLAGSEPLGLPEH